MLRLIGTRLLVGIPVIFLASTFAFFLVEFVPGSPAQFILGNTATPENTAVLNKQLGLDKPLIIQYLTWISKAVRGDFGQSYITNTSVADTLGNSLPPTLSLALIAILVVFIGGQALGLLAAVYSGPLYRAVQAVSNIFMAIPNFWLASILVLVFALKVGVFPATGYTALTDSPSAWALGLVLPVIAISAAFLAQVVMQARASALDVMGRDFVRTLQATGVPRRTIILKHVLRNAAIPVTTVSGLIFIFLLSGAVVVEYTFNIPGVGSLMVNSVTRHDLPVVQGAIVYFSVAVVIVNIAVDILAAWLNPRIRIS